VRILLRRNRFAGTSGPRSLWENATQREVVIESLKADYEVRRGDLRVWKEAGVFKNPSLFLGRSEGKDYPSEPTPAPHARVAPWPPLMHFWTKLSKSSELK
jgi:hypothetical protein